MNTHSTADPIETFVDGLKANATRLRGVALYNGADKRTKTTAPNRIVFYATSADLHARAKREAQIDATITVEAAIWGASERHVWEILRRLFWGWREWTRASSTAPLVDWKSLAWDAGDDGGEQGAPLTVTLILYGQSIDDIDEAGEGLVSEVTFEQEDE